MKQFFSICALFLFAFAVSAQPSNRVRLRQLEAAPGSGYIIQSLNDTCLWVGVSSVVKYQTLRDDGTPLTQRDAINFVATSTVATTLTDDSGNGETEVALSVIPGGVDHGGLAGLSDDDHTQYLLLAGRSTGQTAIGGTDQMTLVGGTGTTADLNLKTTTGVGATGADIHFLVGNNGATEAMTILNNGRVGISTNAPAQPLHIAGNIRWDGTVYDNRGNAVWQQSASGVASNRDLTFGNATYGRNMWGFAANSFTKGTHPALGSYTFYANGETAGGSTVGHTYFKTQTAGAATAANGADFLIELGTKGATGTRDGRVGINTTSPAALLDVTGNGKFSTTLGIGITPASGTALFVHGTGATSATVNTLLENSSGTDLLYLDDSGQLGLLTNLPVRTLHVAGEARIADLNTDTPTRIIGADADGDLNEITVSSELDLTAGVLSVGVVSHASLSDLGWPEDDHDQYLNIFGRAGGQTPTGGINAGDDLTLRSTTNATKGDVIIQDQGGNMILGGAATASRLRMMEASGSGTNYTEFVAQAQAANVTYTLPADDGDAGEQLQTNGSGALSWEPTGRAPDVQEYTSGGTDTYIIPTGVRTVEIVCIGGGGGGGSGRRGATSEANTGGGGGGGGAYTMAIFAVSELSSTTLDLTIGAGGTGGAARSTDNTNGANGITGGDTYVECSGYTLILAEGGDFGRGGSTATAAGGSANDVGDFFGYAGAASPTSGTPSSTTGTFTKAAGGGGAGGSIATGGTPAVNGGACGKWNYATLSPILGGTAPGGNGNDCPAVNTQHWIGGNGGSGGASSITANGGTGGTGARGGGGGGGGAALNATGNSGAGGTGGDGFIMIIAKY